MKTDQQTPPPTPKDLQVRMREAYEAFLAAATSLNPEQANTSGACGEWSAREVVDHLTGWQVQSPPILEAILAEAPDAFEYDIDSFNEAAVAERADLSWEESLKAFTDSYQAFAEAFSAVPEAKTRTNQSFKAWIRAMIQEYAFHLTHLQEAQTFSSSPHKDRHQGDTQA